MLETPRAPYRYNGETRAYPDAKMVWWSGGNPFHHHQDLARLDRVWRAPETVVVMDHSWTATARRADIVLPTTSALERNDLMVSRRDPALIYMSAVIPPIGEARDDFAILAGLAQRMGVAEAFTEGGGIRKTGCAISGRAAKRPPSRLATRCPSLRRSKRRGDRRDPAGGGTADPVRGGVHRGPPHRPSAGDGERQDRDRERGDCADGSGRLPRIPALVSAC